MKRPLWRSRLSSVVCLSGKRTSVQESSVRDAEAHNETSSATQQHELDYPAAKMRLDRLRSFNFVKPGQLAQIIHYGRLSGNSDLIEDAIEMLPYVRMGNVVGYASLIGNLARANKLEEAFFVYGRMKEEGHPINTPCAYSLISASLQHKDINRAYQVLRDMRDHDTKIDAGIINTFLEYFIEKRDVDSVFSIFDVIPKQSDIGINRDQILHFFWDKINIRNAPNLQLSYQFIVKLTAELKRLGERQMDAPPDTAGDRSAQATEHGSNPGQDLTDQQAALRSRWRARLDHLFYKLVQIEDSARADSLLDLMLRDWKLSPNKSSLTSFIKICGSEPSGQYLNKVSQMIIDGTLSESVDVKTWTTLIYAYSRRLMIDEAFRHFDVMRQRHPQLDFYPFKILLIMCNRTKNRERGLELLSLGEQLKITTDDEYNKLADAIRQLPVQRAPNISQSF